MKSYLLTGTLAVAAFLSVGPLRADVIFFDDFQDGASPLWGNEVGDWLATDGVYFAQRPSNDPPTYSSLPFALDDFVIDVDIFSVRDGGIWLRSSDNRNGVLLVTGGHLGTGTGLYWHVVTDGSYGPILNEVTGLFTPGEDDVHIQVVVSGDSYAAYLNYGEEPVTTLTSDAFPCGMVALYDFSGQTFSNVVVAVPD